SDVAAAEAACAALDSGGSAADALVAGFLGAAGARAEVLLAPAIAIAAGVGVGARAFDGRAAQPGRGAARPRGFIDAESVPGAARVAAPRTLPMLILLHGYLGRARLRDLARSGVAAAEQAGAARRAALLRQIGASGVMALRGRDVERALLAAGGSMAGGALTAEDLEGALPGEAEALATAEGDGGAALRSPWPAGAESRPAEVIVACDARGAIAALAYAPAQAQGGVAVPELEVAFARDAVPVRRGIPRVTPGTALPAAAPIAIVQRAGGFAVALGLPGETAIAPAALDGLGSGAALEAALSDVCARTGAQSAVAVVRDGRDARAIVVRRAD
ncbi:MAG: hypothetical protein IT372_42040, partial [Polyangiaceae bacterium]|nr:hypothetical protein [Polyangiaceae bacterium]